MSLRKKWFHFYSTILNVHPSSVKGFGLHFSGMRFSRVVRMGMAVIFSMTSMVQATPKQREAVVKVVMAEIPWNQRPMKLTELMDYGKNFLPPILLQQLQANYMLYGDLEIPKMEVSRVKVGSSEHVRLTMTEKGMTNTITLIDDGKVFARLNDKVDIYKEDMRSLTTVVSKVYQAIPVQPPKGPFLDDWDYRRLTPKGRLEYIKKLREIMVLMEKIQNNSGQGSTSDISKNFPFENSTSEAEVNFDQNPITTTAGIFPHAGFSLTAAAGVFKSWWEYMLSGAEANQKYPLILGGDIIVNNAQMNEHKANQQKCGNGKIYCANEMFPVGYDNNCIDRPRGSQWTKACFEASKQQITVRANEKNDPFKIGNLSQKLTDLSNEINTACHKVKGKASKDGAACSDLVTRINELEKIYKTQTAANKPPENDATKPPAPPAQDPQKERHDRINRQCGAISEGGFSTQLLSAPNTSAGPLKGQALALLNSGGSQERITKPESFTAICGCAEPAVSVYALPQNAKIDVNKTTELTLDSCKPPTPEKPAGGSGGGSSRRSQWWNPSSWCESSTCRMGLGIGAVGLTLGLGIMGYRQSMKMQDRQMKAQQEWYASMLGGGAATMPPTMSLYTPSALRPTDMFNTNSNTNTQDTLR